MQVGFAYLPEERKSQGLTISLRGTWIWLSAAGLDAGEAPELICNFGDGPTGWTDVRRLVLALERSPASDRCTRARSESAKAGRTVMSSAEGLWPAALNAKRKRREAAQHLRYSGRIAD